MEVIVMLDEGTWRKLKSAVTEYRRISSQESVEKAKEDLRQALDGTEASDKVRRLHRELTDYLQQRWDAEKSQAPLVGEEHKKVLDRIDVLDKQIDDCMAGLEPVPTITTDEFDRFLLAFGMEKPCPECATNRWLSFSSQPNSSGERLVFRGDMSSDRIVGVIPLTPLSCENCGYTKLYMTGRIREWLDNNG